MEQIRVKIESLDLYDLCNICEGIAEVELQSSIKVSEIGYKQESYFGMKMDRSPTGLFVEPKVHLSLRREHSWFEIVSKLQEYVNLDPKNRSFEELVLSFLNDPIIYRGSTFGHISIDNITVYRWGENGVDNDITPEHCKNETKIIIN